MFALRVFFLCPLQSQHLRAHWLTFLFKFYFALPNGNTSPSLPPTMFVSLTSYIFVCCWFPTLCDEFIHISTPHDSARPSHAISLNSKAYFLSFTNSPFLLVSFHRAAGENRFPAKQQRRRRRRRLIAWNSALAVARSCLWRFRSHPPGCLFVCSKDVHLINQIDLKNKENINKQQQFVSTWKTLIVQKEKV